MPNELHNKPIVIIESPYAGDIERNVKYACACMADSLARGEAPYASHLLYTKQGVLDDNDPDERELGITAGFSFKHIPGAVTVFYVDYGMSGGMKKALDYCKAHGLDVEIRGIN